MVDYKVLTALELIDDRANVAHESAKRHRDKAETRQERDNYDGKNYNEGKEAGYFDARKIMEAELCRLCNKFQNGCLSIDDFGIVL